jgi:hypothetical protein
VVLVPVEVVVEPPDEPQPATSVASATADSALAM